MALTGQKFSNACLINAFRALGVTVSNGEHGAVPRRALRDGEQVLAPFGKLVAEVLAEQTKNDGLRALRAERTTLAQGEKHLGGRMGR